MEINLKINMLHQFSSKNWLYPIKKEMFQKTKEKNLTNRSFGLIDLILNPFTLSDPQTHFHTIHWSITDPIFHTYYSQYD